ncbi:intracellular septation protein A [Altererythrobacter indicus]|uniref:Inner membrane-spanning protein YciB n=1 Tax=Altericroceibacterium indicum TaxID=374177 RepID=A0A845A7V2_9SPHN|nr:inner membrane-spanning protein YciB [Altericroceibacterium indicum]MXP24646.1 intracellular septation protein A [Altericroceibacterium indicum]
MAETTPTPKKPKSSWINLLVDYGPLLVFLAVYKIASPAHDTSGVGAIVAVIKSTGAFMIAAIVALVVSKWRLGSVSRMLWLSTALIVGFGSLTILLRDPFYVQVKPTALYVFFGVVLLVGWMRGKAFLQWLLEAAFEGLNKEGWLKLSRNWGVFFLFLAVLNEVLRHYLSFGDWLATKIWVFMPLSFLFTFTQLPMLLKHGLSVSDEDEVVKNPPTE